MGLRGNLISLLASSPRIKGIADAVLPVASAARLHLHYSRDHHFPSSVLRAASMAPNMCCAAITQEAERGVVELSLTEGQDWNGGAGRRTLADESKVGSV